MKKLFIFFAALLLTCTTFAQTWHCGYPNAEDVTATFNGVALVIDGTGDMEDYDGSNMPWYSSLADIKTVVIGEAITSIGEYAFAGCRNLVNVTIGGSVTDIKFMAFSGCGSLRALALGSSVANIEAMAFFYCVNLISIEVWPDNATYSSIDGVLCNKDKTTLILCPEGRRDTYTVPNGITSIGGWAFYYCSGLASVIISESVTEIQPMAFSGCSNLTSVIIGSNITSIGESAFEKCNNFTSITNRNPVPQKITGNVFRHVVTQGDTLYVPAASLAAYQEAEVWGNFGAIVAISDKSNNDAEIAVAKNDSTLQQVLEAQKNNSAATTQNFVPLKIYPDPNINGQFTIDNEQLTVGEKIEIYNASGNLTDVYDVLSGASTTISVVHLPAGTYLVKVGNKVGKVSKQIDQTPNPHRGSLPENIYKVQKDDLKSR
ncbi:hypothetical protein AGMMS4956_02990 [Bacteroidia bacterium]|nr:hypothetical protein AGMMS4956_02990 [Bacteroidia bacterium]